MCFRVPLWRTRLSANRRRWQSRGSKCISRLLLLLPEAALLISPENFLLFQPQSLRCFRLLFSLRPLLLLIPENNILSFPSGHKGTLNQNIIHFKVNDALFNAFVNGMFFLEMTNDFAKWRHFSSKNNSAKCGKWKYRPHNLATWSSV